MLQACSRRSYGDNSESAPRFATALPIPPVLEPTRSDEHGDYYEIEARESTAAILPGKQTTIRGYNGIFPGPTIKATRGRPTHVRFTTKLQIPVVTHLHGGQTPSDSDGWPTDVILPAGYLVPANSMQMDHGRDTGRTAQASASNYEHNYTYPNDRRAATLWYHDHAIGATGQNVYLGLAGFYLVEDEEERSLPLPRERYDIPLMLCVRQFNDDGSLQPARTRRGGWRRHSCKRRAMACLASGATQVSLPHSERLQCHNLHSCSEFRASVRTNRDRWRVDGAACGTTAQPDGNGGACRGCDRFLGIHRRRIGCPSQHGKTRTSWRDHAFRHHRSGRFGPWPAAGPPERDRESKARGGCQNTDIHLRFPS